MAKKQALARQDVEVLPADQDEQQLVKDVNAAIADFVRGFVQFFTTAKSLEKKANARLMAARTLRPPTDAASDAVIQRFITSNSDDKKAAEAHWHPITSTVWNFHRWLTAKRKPTLDMHDDAHTLAQPLHNQWVDSEKRRVAREAEERRVENERLAQAERDRELQRLEDAALKAEGASADLSEREQNFVRLVLLWGQSAAARAARESGFKNPDATAVRLLNTPKITKAIEGKKQAASVREQATARAAQPLDVAAVVEEKPQIGNQGSDRTTWSGELLDENALVNAVLRSVVVAYTEALGQPVNDARVDAAFGIALKTSAIPTDLLAIEPKVLNIHARALGENLNRWPGARAKKSTRTI